MRACKFGKCNGEVPESGGRCDMCGYMTLAPMAATRAVISFKDLTVKYGTRTIPLAVEQLIRRAPAFDGDEQLAKLLGEMMADLESAMGSVKA